MSDTVEIKLGPTYGEDIARIRERSCTLTSQEDYTPVFKLSIPLELHPEPIQFDEDGVPLVRFVAKPEERYIDGNGVVPDDLTANRLLHGGKIETSVDSLSRSLVHQPADETTLLETLERESTISNSDLEAIRRQLVTPQLSDELSPSQAKSARDLLSQNIRSHEAQHVRDLIDPKTAMWKEIELLWQLQLIAASPEALKNEAIVKRIAVLYSIPRQFLTELSALLTERFEISDPQVESFITKHVSEQRGLEQDLLEFFDRRNIDREQLSSILKSDAADQYGDIWILYVIQQLDDGRPLDEIDSITFLEAMGIQSPAQYIGIDDLPDSELSALQDDFIELVYAHLYGPAFEVISFDTSNAGEFEICRRWYNTNPTVSGDEHLLAVRRALFLRSFMNQFRSRTNLLSVRNDIKNKISRRLSGYKVSLSPPPNEIDPQQVADDLGLSLRKTAEELVGREERAFLAKWLDDSAYVPSSHS